MGAHKAANQKAVFVVDQQDLFNNEKLLNDEHDAMFFINKFIVQFIKGFEANVLDHPARATYTTIYLSTSS